MGLPSSCPQLLSPFPGPPPWSLTASFPLRQRHAHTSPTRLPAPGTGRARGLGEHTPTTRPKTQDPSPKTKYRLLRCDDVQAQNVPQAPPFCTQTGTRPEQKQNTHTTRLEHPSPDRTDGRGERGRGGWNVSRPLHERREGKNGSPAVKALFVRPSPTHRPTRGGGGRRKGKVRERSPCAAALGVHPPPPALQFEERGTTHTHTHEREKRRQSVLLSCF